MFVLDLQPSPGNVLKQQSSGNVLNQQSPNKALKQLEFPRDMNVTVGAWLHTLLPGLRAEFENLVDERVEADDVRLIQHIRKMIIPPSIHETRKIGTSLINSPQAQEVSRLLNNKVTIILHRC